MTKSKSDLIQEMVEKIQKDSLPAFSRSVQDITAFSNEDEADLEQLSRTIKKDAALSVQILKACNGVYRTRRGRVNTISRALVMLGVKEVQKICLSCWLIEGLTKGSPPKELTREMSMSFYSATQARLFSLLRGDPYSEEVFLSALMLNIGPLAAWKVAADQMNEVNEIVKNEQCSLKQAEERVFGFSLEELSRALTRTWNLEQFIPITDTPTKKEKLRYLDITLSTQLVRSLPFGWKSEVVGAALDDIENNLSASPDRIEAVIRDAAEDMMEMATSFGIAPIGEVIDEMPEILSERTKVVSIDVPADAKTLEDAEASETPLEEPKSTYVPIEPNPEFQLESLQNMSALMMTERKPTMFILHAMGGIHRGLGIDRVLFSLLNDSRTKLSGRIAIGHNKDDLKENFVFDMSSGIESVFMTCFKMGRPLWCSELDDDTKHRLAMDELEERLGATDFFLGPIIVNNKWVGMFYADMAPSERPLTVEAFQGFNQFATQAALAFQHLEFMKQHVKGGGSF